MSTVTGDYCVINHREWGNVNNILVFVQMSRKIFRMCLGHLVDTNTAFQGREDIIKIQRGREDIIKIQMIIDDIGGLMLVNTFMRLLK